VSAQQVVMYDEPTAGLDPVASTVVEDLIRSLHVGRDGGDTSKKVGGISAYIVVTHQHSTIRRAVDRREKKDRTQCQCSIMQMQRHVRSVHRRSQSSTNVAYTRRQPPSF